MGNTQLMNDFMNLTVVVPVLNGILERFGGQGALTSAEQNVLAYAVKNLEERRQALEADLGIEPIGLEGSTAGIPDSDEAGGVPFP